MFIFWEVKVWSHCCWVCTRWQPTRSKKPRISWHIWFFSLIILQILPIWPHKRIAKCTFQSLLLWTVSKHWDSVLIAYPLCWNYFWFAQRRSQFYAHQLVSIEQTKIVLNPYEKSSDHNRRHLIIYFGIIIVMLTGY